jgi:hypothetical protein
VEEAKFGIEEVEVQDQATAKVALQAWPALAIADPEGGARFHAREDGNQARGDALLAGDLTGQVFLADLAPQELRRTTVQTFGVFLEKLCLLGTEILEVLQDSSRRLGSSSPRPTTSRWPGR